MSVAQSQLEASLVEQQKMNEELSQVHLQQDELIREKNSEQRKLTGQLEQTQAQLQQSENAFQDKVDQADALRVQQVTALESELKAANEQRLEGEKQLAVVQSDNTALQQKLLDAEKALSVSADDQEALSLELSKIRGELQAFKEDNDSKQVEIKEAVAANEALKEELSESKKALETKILQAQEALRIKEEALQSSEASLSELANEKEDALNSMEALRQAKLSGDEEVTTLRLKIEEFELSLKQFQDDNKRLVDEANKENNDKKEQLLAAKNEAEMARNKLDEVWVNYEIVENEKKDLEDQLVIANAKNNGLEIQVIDAQRRVSQMSDNKASEERIKELEKQLDDASSMLLDLEIKLEASSIGKNLEPSEPEKDALKALQSELDLVREQTEKDLQAMQAKLENSEKINLVLKKKVLSMQALSNQEVTPEESEKEVKKSWWK